MAEIKRPPISEDLDQRVAQVHDMVKAFEGQQQQTEALLTENGFSAAKMASLARKNGVQEIGARFRQVTEPGFYTEPAAPKPTRRVRTRL